MWTMNGASVGHVTFIARQHCASDDRRFASQTDALTFAHLLEDQERER